MGERLQVDVPEAYIELYRPHRYKVFYGGRGAGKSWQFGRAAILNAVSKPIRVLCVREIQRSISDSVHKLLKEQIQELGFDKFFAITKDAIIGANGSEFIFKGLHNNANEIKSTEGIDICWVEEGQAVSADSWNILTPTIRREGSEIWVSFNPINETDATYQKFIVGKPDGAYIQKVNWNDNPYFPKVLEEEKNACKKRDYQEYLHIWEGECKKISKALIFGGHYTVEEFETPDGVRFYHGSDWGFACLVGDTVVSTNKGDKLLKDIKIGDNVLTRGGYKRVVYAQSRGIKKVYDVTFGNGFNLTATSDHRIYTADGWKRVDELKGREKICVMRSSLTAKLIKGILTANTQITTLAQTEKRKDCTEQFGNSITEIFRMGAIYTIKTAIHLIMILTTLFVLLKANTKKSIIGGNWEACQKKNKQEGVTQKEIGQSVGRRLWKRLKNDVACVLSAGKNLLLPTYIKNSVRLIAESTKTRGTAKENTPVNVAVRFLQRLLTTLEKHALVNVPINLQSKGEAEVFDITLENGEYFANGVLVHNCDPTTLIRSFMKDNKIYIDYEAGGVGVDLDETSALFDIIPTARKWPIKADCARPETISFMRHRGFNVTAAAKWQGSIEDGIEWLKAHDIIVNPRCVHLIDEFEHYSYKQDKNTGEILPIIIDANNHYIDALRYAYADLIKGKGGMMINPKAIF